MIAWARSKCSTDGHLIRQQGEDGRLLFFLGPFQPDVCPASKCRNDLQKRAATKTSSISLAYFADPAVSEKKLIPATLVPGKSQILLPMLHYFVLIMRWHKTRTKYPVRAIEVSYAACKDVSFDEILDPLAHTSWSGHKNTDIHSIGIFALIWPYYNSKIGTMVPEPAESLHMLEILESEMISSRNALSSRSRHVHKEISRSYSPSYKTPKTLYSGWRWFSVQTFLEAWPNDRYPPHRLIRCLSTDMRCIWSAIQS